MKNTEGYRYYLNTDYPKPLLEILPWYISGGEIIVTQECVDYLKALSEEYKNQEDKNSVCSNKSIYA